MRLNLEIKIGAGIIFIIIIMSLISIIWSPYDYNEINHDIRLIKPGLKHLLGTDHLGRDIFSRIMAGGRNSLVLALCTVISAATIGCLLGLLAGYLGGITDEIILRIIDILNSFPGIILALFMVAIMDNGVSKEPHQFGLFFALLIVFIPSYTRIIRTGAMQYKTYDFIKAEIILGANFFRITFFHILPNLFPSLLSASILGLSNAILAESAMSYLGLGIQPPNPSWGRMLFEAQSWFFNAPWYALSPGIFITLTVISFHYLGEGLKRSFRGYNGTFT